MRPFVELHAIAAPLDRSNVDTDLIIPARFLRRLRPPDGLGAVLFHDLRHDDTGRNHGQFVLDQEAYRAAEILVADDNFGCGSSREGAVYALADAHGQMNVGIRSVIAPSFADIFYGNCLQNGVLPVRLDGERCARWRKQLHDRPGARIRIDLPSQTAIGPDGEDRASFEIDPFKKKLMLRGLDEIELTRENESAIAAHEQTMRGEKWRLPRADTPR